LPSQTAGLNGRHFSIKNFIIFWWQHWTMKLWATITVAKKSSTVNARECGMF
jgi:hypothetical protein